MAHAPLLRQNTAPVFQQQPAGGVGSMLSKTMSMSGVTPRASQLSGSTAFNSTTSLNSLASASTLTNASNGQVMATSNIINQQADASRSLFQICMSLKQRLSQVPDFEMQLSELDALEQGGSEEGGIVEALWQLLRRGYPLLIIYNTLNPEKPLAIASDDKANEAKKAKMAIYNFIRACLTELNIAPADCFVINDLTGTDTSGFVKVTGVVNHVLDLCEARGLLRATQPYPGDDVPAAPGKTQMTQRDYIVRELVDTERKYVQDLENLHDLKNTLEQSGAIPGDVVHDIFMNINAILDFQRRFLIRVETNNSMPPLSQRWGSPFAAYEDSFGLYLPFIADQRKASLVAQSVFDKISLVGHPVACDFNTLDGFLLKPMQRLVKYPLLLKDLLKKTEDADIKADLAAGIASAERVLQKANETLDRDQLDLALEDLMQRVDDWKNHKVDQFGRLLLHGVHTVLTGKSDQVRDYEIYLFECILLCCKEIPPNKSTYKKDKTRSTGGPKLRKGKLQLKGRIFMTNVTEVLSFSKPGSYEVQIWWKGDPGIENFIVKFQNEETMKKWASGLDIQRKKYLPEGAQSPDDPAPEFTWLRSQSAIENPYAQNDDDDDVDYSNPTPAGYGNGPLQAMAGTMPRTASSASLRTRTNTSESTQSLASIARAPPPRFPLPAPPTPLSLQTQGAPSPGPRGGDSYFSPVAESPASSRTSTTSNIFPQSAGYAFPRVGTPSGGWEGDMNRYTAPAMPRAPSRDGPSPVNAYGMVNGRNPRGPSLPAMPQNAQSLAQQQRSRSYSTPDIQGQQARRTPGGSQGNIPAVPGIPPHLHPAHERHDSNIPRSNSGSPRNDLPIRSNTQSPGMQSQRMHGHGQHGGSMSHFPTQPMYPRQGTPTNHSGLAPAPLNLSADYNGAVEQPLGTGTPAMGPGGIMSPDGTQPTQLVVKVNYDTANYITLIVRYNTTYDFLVDRIDNKLARFTNSSIARGQLKLRYQDEDGDFVAIEGDDDIHICFMEWRATQGEIELFCVGSESS